MKNIILQAWKRIWKSTPTFMKRLCNFLWELIKLVGLIFKFIRFTNSYISNYLEKKSKLYTKIKNILKNLSWIPASYQIKKRNKKRILLFLLLSTIICLAYYWDDISVLKESPIYKIISPLIENKIETWPHSILEYLYMVYNNIKEYLEPIYKEYNWIIDPIVKIIYNLYTKICIYFTYIMGYTVPETTIKENETLWYMWIWGILIPIHIVLTWEFSQYACIWGGEHHAFVKARRDFPQYWKKWHVTGDDVWHYFSFLLASHILEMREEHGYIIAIRNYIRFYVHNNRIYGEEEATMYRQFKTLGDWWLDPDTSGKVDKYLKWGKEPWEDDVFFEGRAPRYGKEWSWWADGCFIWKKSRLTWYGKWRTFHQAHNNQLNPIIKNLCKKEPELFNHERIIFWQMPFLTEGNLQKKWWEWSPGFFVLPYFPVTFLETDPFFKKKKYQEDYIRMINTINWQTEAMDSRHHMGAYATSTLKPWLQPEGFPKSPVSLGRQWFYFYTDLLAPQTTSKGCHLQTIIAIQKKIQILFIKNKDQFKKIISPELFWKIIISKKKKIQNQDPWFVEWNNIINNHESLVWSKGKNAMDMYVFIIGNGDAWYKLHLEIWNKIELESRFYNQCWIASHYSTNTELLVVFFNEFKPFS